ncbi:MAG: hypothetical protein MUP76_08200, partial [Acidimicrobiia bacterium]|nr:hypothetical protein [Acidimicrobiia bacterium]
MSEETLSRIAGWCEAENDLSIEASTITVAGNPPLELTAEVDADALRLTYTHSVTSPPHGFADDAGELLGQRGSMVVGEVVTGTASTEMHLRYPIYLDGLNRQSFLVAVREITGTVDGLERIAAATAAPAEEQPAPATTAGPTPPPSQPEPRPAVSAAPAPWAPTHQVPATGMAAWSHPDPSVAPVANLSPGVQLRLDEQRGAWASVTGSIGWTGWVDARILQSIGAASPAAAPAGWVQPAAGAAASRATTGAFPMSGVHILGVIGAVAMVIGLFLDWGGGNAFDVPAASAWPIYEVVTWSQPTMGLVLLVAAGLILVASLVPAVPPAVRVGSALIGSLLTAGVVATIGINASWGDVADIQFLGLGVALVGGIIALI